MASGVEVEGGHVVPGGEVPGGAGLVGGFAAPFRSVLLLWRGLAPCRPCVYRGTYRDQVKSQFLGCRLLLFELGPYPGDGGDVIVIEGIDEIFLH
jgi:hypothetical protein